MTNNELYKLFIELERIFNALHYLELELENENNKRINEIKKAAKELSNSFLKASPSRLATK